MTISTSFAKLSTLLAGRDAEPFVIAEIGVNHDGSTTRAIELVDAAAASGCDAVKFQVWTDPERYPDLRFDVSALRLINDFCEERDIIFFATPDDVPAALWLNEELDVRLFKTSSADLRNLHLLETIACFRKPMLMSTGAASIDDVTLALGRYGRATTSIIPMHCTSAYPAPMAESNLAAVAVLAGLDYVPAVGFSDHTTGFAAAQMACALGARVFEKHLTHSKVADGPDHAMSFERGQLALYVSTLRMAYKALGDGVKRVMPCERAARAIFDSRMEKGSYDHVG